MAPPKIIIAGAPASGKGTQCEFIRAAYGCVHLSTGDMLREAAAAGTPTGLIAQEFMNAGKLVTDEIIIGIIKDRLAMQDCQTKGWLLDGFPRTRVQADALSAAGITADVFLFLDVPDSLLVERVCGRRTDPVTGTIYHMKFNPPPSEEVAARVTQRSDDTEEKVLVRLEGFHSNIAAIIDCYESVLVKVNGSGDKHNIYALLNKFIDGYVAKNGNERSKAKALFGSALEAARGMRSDTGVAAAERALKTCLAPKIIIAGAPASGKGTQCEFIRAAYGCVHLSTGDMLREAAAAGTPTGLIAQEFMNAGKLVTDEIIIGIIKDRLAMQDCQTKGWLLDGFPRTRVQADALSAAGITADVFLFLDVPDSLLVERVCGRRTDPVTGTIYHMKFNPPPSEEVAARVTQRSDDTEEKVKVRLEGFHSNIAAIIDCYTNVLVKVNGSGDKHSIYALLEMFIDGYGYKANNDVRKANYYFKTALGASKVMKSETGIAAANRALNSLTGGGYRPPSKGLKLIIAGAPASGKGTQCEVIRDRYGCVHLSTGDMLREAAAAGTPTGLIAQEFMNAGKLVTDEIIIGIIKERLAMPDCVAKGWLLDGFPRTRVQADALAEAGIKCDSFIFLDVPDSDLVERVTGRRTDPVTGKGYHLKFLPPPNAEVAARLTQRSDDTEDKVKVRIQQFHANVASIIDCYKFQKYHVMGNQHKDVVCKQITKHLDIIAKFNVVFVLGGPGSGKGTQCERIRDEFGYTHLSAGDLLRAEKESGSDTAKMIDSYIKEGKIVPAEVTVGLLKKAMQASGKKKFLVDGFPRSKDNLDSWYTVMGDECILKMALVFDCPEAVLEERLLNRGKTSGRSDDNIESIKKRFTTFKNESAPVINEFRRMGQVKVIDSTPPPDVVYSKVRRLMQGADRQPPLERTLAMIKPDAVAAGKADEIIARIKDRGFVVVAQKQHQLSQAQAEEFYAEHVGKGFFADLSGLMTSGPLVALLLEKPGAIKSWREMMGPTNADKARETAPKSLRALYGAVNNSTKNATHGSDSFISASREAKFWFPEPLATERTLAMIKPIISETKYESVLSILEYRGFKVVAETKQVLSERDVATFYKDHNTKDWFPKVSKFMQSGPVVALCLEREGAIQAWRELIGMLQPRDARTKNPKSLRAIYGTDDVNNGTHGSDSVEGARREIAFWFNANRVGVPKEGGAAGGAQQMDALEYLKQYVDPIFAPLLQKILAERPKDVSAFVGGELGGK